MLGVTVGDDFVARFADAYRVELHAWVESVRSGMPAGPSAWDGYLANQVAFAAVASLEGAGRVEVAQETRPDIYG